VNHNRWIVGLIIFAVLISLIAVVLVTLLRDLTSSGAQIGQREPLPGLAYCSASQVKPCIVSFSLDADGNMIINLLTERFYSPIFYLKIKHNEGTNIYNCRKTTTSSSSVSCVGQALPPGVAMQFQIISAGENILLAGGYFPIIGLAVATPDNASTASLETPLTPPSTDGLVNITPAPIASPFDNASPPPFPTDDFIVNTPTSSGPPSNGSPPPFATNDSLLTPTSTGGPPGESSPPPGGGPPP
jgi:hypothetical protein